MKGTTTVPIAATEPKDPFVYPTISKAPGFGHSQIIPSFPFLAFEEPKNRALITTQPLVTTNSHTTITGCRRADKTNNIFNHQSGYCLYYNWPQMTPKTLYLQPCICSRDYTGTRNRFHLQINHFGAALAVGVGHRMPQTIKGKSKTVSLHVPRRAVLACTSHAHGYTASPAQSLARRPSHRMSSWLSFFVASIPSKACLIFQRPTQFPRAGSRFPPSPDRLKSLWHPLAFCLSLTSYETS
ncbi:uncharacterized protein CLUP02_13673 [Colletotrichum lupini]|uniref:Uncharacterized protein n=1 Tax=Colletotrichum lupini TaxID=145971 RepID=A0A9Q8T3J5_9PEZI|nr:uncharacterized protein CLUP02_13673 [Colletotrichum lupini]UQC88150.1 hypothetical protein CLUP02_13673 [Colletotrichum lupini]